MGPLSSIMGRRNQEDSVRKRRLVSKMCGVRKED
jgi:hypothetical protein